MSMTMQPRQMRPAYQDGTVMRGPDNDLFVLVSGELCPVEDVPLPRDADSSAIIDAIGFVPPQLSAEQVAALPRGKALRGLLEDYREDEVVSDMPRRYMATHARLSQEEGRIDGTTRTWTRQPWFGFTGGVVILFVGANDEVIGNTDLHQFGVDGFRIPFKRWNREDHWAEGVDPGIAARVVRLEIQHTHAPKDRLMQALNDAVAAAKQIGEVVAIIAAL
jgi:hypothetical protein